MKCFDFCLQELKLAEESGSLLEGGGIMFIMYYNNVRRYVTVHHGILFTLCCLAVSRATHLSQIQRKVTSRKCTPHFYPGTKNLGLTRNFSMKLKRTKLLDYIIVPVGWKPRSHVQIGLLFRIKILKIADLQVQTLL